MKKHLWCHLRYKNPAAGSYCCNCELHHCEVGLGEGQAFQTFFEKKCAGELKKNIEYLAYKDFGIKKKVSPIIIENGTA